jgi:hypothetical protein
MKNLATFCEDSPLFRIAQNCQAVIFATIQELEFNPILTRRACCRAIVTPDPPAAGQIRTESAPV